MAGRRWWVVGDRMWMVRVVDHGCRHPLIRSGALAVVVLSLLGVPGCLPWCGDGFVVGRHVVVAVGSVVDVVVVG